MDMSGHYARLFPDQRQLGETTSRKCQLVMIRMLRIFDDICRHHHIDYWMTAGRLIGAIRHKGFIPWDGDIDLGITEEDLKKFKSVHAELPPDIFYQDQETDPFYTDLLNIVKVKEVSS